MTQENETIPVFAATAAEWRSWLAEHSTTEREAWLVLYHRKSGIASVGYEEAVEQALCFGWIDGLQRRRDEHSSQLRFTPRRPRSTWSESNRQRVSRLIESGQMTPHGLAVIEQAKAAGTW